MTRVAAGFSSSGRLRLPPEENPKGSHHLAGSNTKNAQFIIAIDPELTLGKLHILSRLFTANTERTFTLERIFTQIQAVLCLMLQK